MNMKHTPGPWSAHHEYFFGHDSFMVNGTVGDTSPFLSRFSDSTPDYEANALLVAQAPELLLIAIAYRNLLKTMAHTEGEVATFNHINAVIAAAGVEL